MSALKDVNTILKNTLEVYKKAGNDVNVKHINDFFDTIKDIPLVKLYTKEGKAYLDDYISDTTERQNAIVEFLLRLKPSIENVYEFDKECYLFTRSAILLDEFYEGDSKEFEKYNITLENIHMYYIFNIILAYNTIIN